MSEEQYHAAPYLAAVPNTAAGERQTAKSPVGRCFKGSNPSGFAAGRASHRFEESPIIAYGCQAVSASAACC